MAVDIFMFFTPPQGFSVNDFKGETQDAFFSKKNAFEIRDINWSTENKATIGSATSGAGGGKVQFNEVTVSKSVDKGSPFFFKAEAAGAHFPSMTIAFRKAGSDDSANNGMPYYAVRFGTVFITKIERSMSGGEEGIQETITFAVGQMTESYAIQNPDGSLATKRTEVGWDQVKNKSVVEIPDIG